MGRRGEAVMAMWTGGGVSWCGTGRVRCHGWDERQDEEGKREEEMKVG